MFGEPPTLSPTLQGAVTPLQVAFACLYFFIRSLGLSTSWRTFTLDVSSTSGIPSRLTLIPLCMLYIIRQVISINHKNGTLQGCLLSLTRLLASLRCEATRIPTVAPPHSPWHGRLIGYSRLRQPSRLLLTMPPPKRFGLTLINNIQSCNFGEDQRVNYSLALFILHIYYIINLKKNQIFIFYKNHAPNNCQDNF